MFRNKTSICNWNSLKISNHFCFRQAFQTHFNSSHSFQMELEHSSQQCSTLKQFTWSWKRQRVRERGQNMNSGGINQYTKESIKLWTKCTHRQKKNGWFWKQIPLFAIALNRSEQINCRKWKSVEESSVFKTVASEWWAQKIAKRLTREDSSM